MIFSICIDHPVGVFVFFSLPLNTDYTTFLFLPRRIKKKNGGMRNTRWGAPPILSFGSFSFHLQVANPASSIPCNGKYLGRVGCTLGVFLVLLTLSFAHVVHGIQVYYCFALEKAMVIQRLLYMYTYLHWLIHFFFWLIIFFFFILLKTPLTIFRISFFSFSIYSPAVFLSNGVVCVFLFFLTSCLASEWYSACIVSEQT